MTQYQQVDLLELFRAGDHKLIVATSVAQEGLDIAKCNVVVRYNHISSVVARVQARGKYLNKWNILNLTYRGFLNTNLGPILRTKYVKNTHGNKLRPIIESEVIIAGEKVKGEFTLSDRSNMKYPILIGQDILLKGFIIDPLFKR